MLKKKWRSKWPVIVFMCLVSLALTLGALAAEPSSDAEAVAADKEALEIIYADGDSEDSVTKDLELSVSGSVYGSAITWESNNEDVITDNGNVTRPSYSEGNTEVTLTATLTYGEESDTKEFILTVLKADLTDEEALSVPPTAAKFITEDTVDVEGVPAGATATVYCGIYYEGDYFMTPIGQAMNTEDTTATVTVTLDNAITMTDDTVGYFTLKAAITESGKAESEHIYCDYSLETVEEEFEVLGGTDENDPLRIEVGDQGSIGVYMWQNVRYVEQYFGGNCSGSNIYYDVNGIKKHLVTPYYPYWVGDCGIPLGIGTQTKDGNTVKTVWLTEGGALKITQTIRYTPGQRYFEKSWQFENMSNDKEFTDLKFFHGGDTYFGGIDDSRSYWNEALGMIYLKNTGVSETGLMGFAGSPDTPADRYFGGYYDDGNNLAAEESELPNTADDDYVDAGYQLQWNHDSLEEGDVWGIVAFERWTEAGDIQIMAPAGKTAYTGNTIGYEFILQNFQAEEDTFELNVVSSNGWEATITGGNIVTISGNGGTKNITVNLNIPAGAGVTTDTLTLTAVSQTDSTVTQTAEVVTETLVRERRSSGGGSSRDKVPPYWYKDDVLTAGDFDGNSLTLTWPEAKDNESVKNYRIYVNDELLDTVDSDVFSYDVTNLDPNKEYIFRIEAVDDEGNVSKIDLETVITTASETESAKTILLTVGSLEASVAGTPYTLDAPPYILQAEGRTLVPIRFVSEALGAKVEWLAATQQVKITMGETVILLTINSKQATINGSLYQMDSAPVLNDPGRVFVPVRFISENLGATVKYDQVTGQITILMPAGE